MKHFSEDHKEIQSGKKLDDEGYMAQVEMDKIDQSLNKLKKVVKSSKQQLPAWVQSKITKASDYLDIAADYLSSDVEMSEGSQHIRDREIYTTGKVLRGDKSQLTRSTGAGALTSSAAKELGPKAVELRKKKAASVSLPNLSNVKEEMSLVDKILSEMMGDKPGCDTKKAKPLDKISKKHDVSIDSLKKELKKGIKVEMEHTTDKGEAETIALHHLEELPDYYTRLINMEKGADRMDEAKKYMSKDEDPCWKGYEMVGFKKKKGKKVPNCVPVKEEVDTTNKSIQTSRIKALLDRRKAIDSEITAARRGAFNDQNLEEATTRLPMQTGQLLRVLVNWRGKHLSVQMFFPQLGTPKRDEITYAVNKIYPDSKVISYVPCEMDSSTPIVQVKEDWQQVNKKDSVDGMSQKAVNAYKRENPGSNLQTAVTEKNPTGKRKNRQKGYCDRSKGQQEMHNIDCSKTQDKPICKARRRWNCKN